MLIWQVGEHTFKSSVLGSKTKDVRSEGGGTMYLENDRFLTVIATRKPCVYVVL